MAVCYGYEESLLNRCILKVIDCLPSLIDEVATVPPNLKERIIFLMQKRGLLTDLNISKVLYDNLRDLDLSECEVGDVSLAVIASRCRNLKKFDLNAAKSSRTTVTTEGVTLLARGCPRLQVVYLRRCISITDEAIVALAQCCPGLRDLNIGGCPRLTDESLIALGQHSASLSSINFSLANVTDTGVFSMVRGVCAVSLKEIHMAKCQNVTDDAIEAVIQFCPKISILIFHGCPGITGRAWLNFSPQSLEEHAEKDLAGVVIISEMNDLVLPLKTYLEPTLE